MNKATKLQMPDWTSEQWMVLGSIFTNIWQKKGFSKVPCHEVEQGACMSVRVNDPISAESRLLNRSRKELYDPETAADQIGQ
jgi:hypothetical protein